MVVWLPGVCQMASENLPLHHTRQLELFPELQAFQEQLHLPSQTA